MRFHPGGVHPPNRKTCTRTLPTLLCDVIRKSGKIRTVPFKVNGDCGPGRTQKDSRETRELGSRLPERKPRTHPPPFGVRGKFSMCTSVVIVE